MTFANNLYKNSKTRSGLIVFEGFGIALLSHTLGGYYLAPHIAYSFPSLPHQTVGMLSTSAISPVAAIIYLAFRLRYLPRFKIKRETFILVVPAIILIWLITIIGTLLLGKEDIIAQEVLRTPKPFLYLNVFLLIFWGPLVEEVLFRGYLFETLRKIRGDIFALCATSILFVIPHGLWWHLYYIQDALPGNFLIFGISLVFIGVYSAIYTALYIAGGLITAIVAHMFTNFYLLYLNM